MADEQKLLLKLPFLPYDIVAQILIYASSNSRSHGYCLRSMFLLQFMKEKRLRNQICLFYPKPEELLGEACYQSSGSVCAELIQIHGMKIVPSYFKDNLLEFAVRCQYKNLFKLVCENPQWELEYKTIKETREKAYADHYRCRSDSYTCYDSKIMFRIPSTFRKIYELNADYYRRLYKNKQIITEIENQAKLIINGQRMENKYKLQANRRASKKGWLNYNS